MADDSPSVQAIDSTSVHQICSGQVVLNLATAVKELVENSLDAGATNVGVRLKESGAELLEVVDNGSGVEPGNFNALTLKHHTSKLRDFSDLASVDTFGFRGEALSSLCALSNLSIATRHLSEIAGSKLEYDHNGKLTSQNPCARECGTTVTLQNLFYTLPVRHKEFVRNIKRELSKLVLVLQGYCLVSTGVRITCSNQQDKGKKTTIVSTNGGMHIKDNITCVFGHKQVQSIMLFTQSSLTTDDCDELGLDAKHVPQENNPFHITGFISKPDHGLGRSSADRQFFFINKRPCDLNKVSRVVNEVYHMYNRHQYPFVMMDISLARDCVDVNVTPDKRQVFIQEEKLLLATIKSSLKKMYEPYSSTYSVNEKPLTQLKMSSTSDSCHSSDNDDCSDGSCERVRESTRNKIPLSHLRRSVFPSLSGFKRPISSVGGTDVKMKEPRSKQAKLTKLVVRQPQTKYTFSGLVSGIEKKPSTTIIVVEDEVVDREESKSEVEESDSTTVNAGYFQTFSQAYEADEKVSNEEISTDSTATEENIPISLQGGREQVAGSCGVELVIPKSYKAAAAQSMKLSNISSGRKEVSIDFDFKTLRTSFEMVSRQTTKESVEARSFRAKITPESNQAAENELCRQVEKRMFSQMEILGQFNLGFIVTKLGNDLFIIDQHASDEKFNFEDQQQNTTLHAQRLVIPQRLELTAVNESILIDNIEIFRKNGFDFEIDENALATKKVKLTSLPISKNWTFGVEDIEELIFMLSDSPGVVCRPSRVRKMFASRSCRMSVMVGTALNGAQMRKIVNHMGVIEQPWNCPHGRPTMRHLINLGMIYNAESRI